MQEKTVYTYFMPKEDVKWSDGTPYTSDEILFGYHVINSQFVDGDSLRVYYQDLVACDALDKYTGSHEIPSAVFQSI